jgi:hypothetical protein
MDNLVSSLGPAFAAGFAVQRLLELLDPLLEKVKIIKDNKKVFLGLITLTIALLLAYGMGVRVMEPLGITTPSVLDNFVAALIISAGTEGINSVLKFLGYSKEDKKLTAAKAKYPADKDAVDRIQTTV